MLCHAETGEFMQSDYPINVKDVSNPQQLGSALSYARRYGIQSILNLNASDDDGQMASNPVQVSKEPIVKEKITMKSTRWKGKTENYVISQIKANKKSDDIINELSKSLDLADDVIQFIEDNAGAA